MNKVTRRMAIRATVAGAVGVSTAALADAAAGDEAKVAKLRTLEGELKVHPKFLYRYYIVLLDGQKCALFGADHDREPERLARVDLLAFVRVRGVLGTQQHLGGTKENPTPFPKGRLLYMDVHEVESLKYDLRGLEPPM